MNRSGIPPEVAQAILDASRWDVDQAITNHSGERVWLGPSFNRKGERTGITDCCLVDDPCEHHAAIAAALTQPRPTTTQKPQDEEER